MSENVLIVLIIALAVIIVLFMFRGTLARFFLKANREGIETELQTHERELVRKSESETSIDISGNKQVGHKNKIDVGHPNVTVSDNLQLGKDQEIQVKTNKKAKRNS